jgi:hypothetical protein
MSLYREFTEDNLLHVIHGNKISTRLSEVRFLGSSIRTLKVHRNVLTACFNICKTYGIYYIFMFQPLIDVSSKYCSLFLENALFHSKLHCTI